LRASMPFAKAQVELFEFTETAGETRVRWTLALEPRLLARVGAPLAGRVTSGLFRHAMEGLAAYLERTGASERRTAGRGTPWSGAVDGAAAADSQCRRSG